MTIRLAPTLVLAALALGLPAPARGADAASEWDRNWPQWRGPRATGEAPHADPPVEWGEGKNLKWKASIPGRGHSTPAVWGDRVFVTTSVPTDRKPDAPPPADDPGPHGRKGPPMARAEFIHRFAVLAISRGDGKVLWEKTVREELPHQKTQVDGSWASGSPVTDGRHVWAFFGSRGLHCLTVDGEIRWQKDFGKMSIKMEFGEGSSPFLHGDRILVQWDHEGASFLAALEKETGREVWKVDRDERSTWSTPVVAEAGGRALVLASGTRRVRAYDLATGALAWECPGMTENPIPSPVAGNGMAFFASGFRGNAVLAIRLDGARGNLEGTDAVAWTSDRNAPYVPSPLLHGGLLYLLRQNNADLSCLDAGTGKEHYAARRLEALKGDYASPVAAAGRIYVQARNGAAAVLEAGPEGKVLAVNSLGDEFTASPAVVGGDLVLRGHRTLYCVSKKEEDMRGAERAPGPHPAFEEDAIPTSGGDLKITFVGHGTLMFSHGGKVIHVDPVSSAADYARMPKADLVLITHEHGDHMDLGAIAAVAKPGTAVALTEKCAAALPGCIVMGNGDERTVAGVKVEAVPAYNLVHKRPNGAPFHPRGDGNGYVLTFGDKRVYVAGDSENTPEMKAMKDIAVAFVPMNLPYTMTPEMVADAAKAFRPRILYPYHFGETDPSALAKLLAEEKDIELRIRKMK